MAELRLSEKAMYSTVKLKCQHDDKTIYGTGFIYKFFRTGEYSYPVIVTNRHILYGSSHITFYLNRGDDNNLPIHGDPIEVPLSRQLQEQIVYHPNGKTDLALLPIGGIINKCLEDGDRPFYTGIDSSTIPEHSKWDELHALEDVLVVGYPNNLEDEINKLPIFIKGNTATHPCIDFNQREEFLINANLYPGSSGSPVFLVDENFLSRSRQYQEGRDYVKLLGILCGGYSYPIFERANSGGEDKLTNYISPMNICNVIRSTKIRDFDSIMQEKVRLLEYG